jgi:drug/metabolite transporter (DMT)-like permease
MLLRGGGIIFVAIMKHFVLKDALRPAMWLGVAIIAGGVMLVGFASTVGAEAEQSRRRLGAAAGDEAAGGGEGEGGGGGSGTDTALFGVMITLAGTFVQSVQYTYEEKVMSGDVSAPPWLLIGVEGVTGTLLSTFVLYPIAWFMPGNDNGSYEDPFNTLAMVRNTPQVLTLSLLFCVLVFILNAFSVLVTYLMSSVWHAILDNFRPVTIWAVQLTGKHTWRARTAALPPLARVHSSRVPPTLAAPHSRRARLLATASFSPSP